MVKQRPFYFPYILFSSLHVELEWDDAKAVHTFTHRKIDLKRCALAFLDENRIFGLSQTKQTIVRNPETNELFTIEEDRYCVQGNGIFVVFVLRGLVIRIITAYLQNQDNEINSVRRLAYGIRAEPEIISTAQSESEDQTWVISKTLPNGQFIAHQIVYWDSTLKQSDS